MVLSSLALKVGSYYRFKPGFYLHQELDHCIVRVIRHAGTNTDGHRLYDVRIIMGNEDFKVGVTIRIVLNASRFRFVEKLDNYGT